MQFGRSSERITSQIEQPPLQFEALEIDDADGCPWLVRNNNISHWLDSVCSWNGTPSIPKYESFRIHIKDRTMQSFKAKSHGAPRRRTVALPLHERSMWSVREWSAMNGISIATAYRWIGKGDLVLSKWRGRSFVTREASDAWRARMAAGAAPVT
jgi:hypothetical protein